VSGLLVERDGPVTQLTLNRPEKANALDEALVEALLAAVKAAQRDGKRLLVLRPGSKNFSAGFDFTGAVEGGEARLLWRFVRIEQLLQAVYHAPFATMAIAHGRNFGAGADLFVACDVRIAAPGTTFRMPGLRFGLQLGTRRLAQRIGSEAARAVLAESRTLDASAALDLGFATRVAAASEWENLVATERERSIALSPESVARLRAATATDTRSADMADLVESVTVPALTARIAAYLQEGRARDGA
jgi:enoyl-CoA hydratase/carnithine racemase